MRAGYRRRCFPAAVLAVFAACSAGCHAEAIHAAPSAPSAPVSVPVAAGKELRSPAASAAPVNPAAVGANELGAVPVLMYHQFLSHPRGDYDQTLEQFRTELTALYAHGYRTVTAADLVAGRLDVQAGRKPMVLTFDDGTPSQYAERPDGSIDPQTAVAVLLQVAKQAGEDRPVATFYVNGAPFGGHPEYLRRLHALGMEIGDHTFDHANLRSVDDAAVQSELARGQSLITATVPAAPVTTMALPFGVLPLRPALAVRGSSGGVGYAFAGVFAVGSNPAPSPFSTSFEPSYVPRIRSGNRAGNPLFTSTDWLPRLFSGRLAPYVSDGDPTHISFPRAAARLLSPRFASRARPY